jgi:hypothetical protein
MGLSLTYSIAVGGLLVENRLPQVSRQDRSVGLYPFLENVLLQYEDVDQLCLDLSQREATRLLALLEQMLPESSPCT